MSYPISNGPPPPLIKMSKEAPQPFGKFPNKCGQHDCGAYLTNMSYYAATIKSELVTRDIWELR